MHRLANKYRRKNMGNKPSGAKSWAFASSITGKMDINKNKLEFVNAPTTMDQRTCQDKGTFAA